VDTRRNLTRSFGTGAPPKFAVAGLNCDMRSEESEGTEGAALAVGTEGTEGTVGTLGAAFRVS
jgi:hypothetical protein